MQSMQAIARSDRNTRAHGGEEPYDTRIVARMHRGIRKATKQTLCSVRRRAHIAGTAAVWIRSCGVRCVWNVLVGGSTVAIISTQGREAKCCARHCL